MKSIKKSLFLTVVLCLMLSLCGVLSSCGKGDVSVSLYDGETLIKEVNVTKDDSLRK